MPDPRLIARARKLIQDIHIYHADYRDKLVCAVLLHDGSGNSMSLDAHEFAKILSTASFPSEYETRQSLHPADALPGFPAPQDACLVVSRDAGHCFSREDALRLAPPLILAISDATGLSVDEVLSKVNVREVNESVTADEIRSCVADQQRKRDTWRLN